MDRRKRFKAAGVTPPALAERIAVFLADPHLTDLKQIIAYQRTIFSYHLEQMKDPEHISRERLLDAFRCLDSVAIAIEKYHKIGHDEKALALIQRLVDATVAAAHDFIPNDEARKKFLSRLELTLFEGSLDAARN
jgi:hypothetical protein